MSDKKGVQMNEHQRTTELERARNATGCIASMIVNEEVKWTRLSRKLGRPRWKQGWAVRLAAGRLTSVSKDRYCETR